MKRKPGSKPGPDPGQGVLDESTVLPDPFAQFSLWFSEAVESGIPEPEAMFLATTDRSGRPSGRMVLLKAFDTRGFVFFSCYSSRKGDELKENPFAAITFRWTGPDRQIRIEGKVIKTSKAESDAYFSSRPPGSRLGAAVSPQSREIPGRAWLEEKQALLEEKFRGKDIPRPKSWGGYRIVPDRFEFWQGRTHRLHDRIVFRKLKRGWERVRLAP